MHRRLPTLGLWLALFCATLHAQNRDIDVLSYRFDLALSDQSPQIEAQAQITLRVTAAKIDSIVLDLIGPGTGGQGMAVSQVGGDAQGFAQRDGRIGLALRSPAHEGDTLRVWLDYGGVPTDGLIIGDNRHGHWTAFGDNWPNRARHWLPCVDHPSDKALVEWRVTTPSRYQVAAAGRLIETRDLGDGRRMTRYVTAAPLATKLMVAAAGEFAVLRMDDSLGVEHQAWVYPEDREGGFSDLAVAPAVGQWLGRLIGPFAYAKLAHVQSRTRYGGTENAGAIFYHENAFSGDGNAEGLIVHEMVHQWFGDAVTEADWPHLWLSEGFATYLTHCWFEHRHGAQRMAQRLARDREQVIAFARRRPDLPVLDTLTATPEGLLNANSYQKGSWVLHMLRCRLGDQHFFDGLRTFYAAFKNRNATTQDFVSVMNAVSGQDNRPFLDQWLKRPGVPEIEIAWQRRGAETAVTLNQVQPSDAYALEVELELALEDGTTQGLRVELAGREKEVRIKTPSPISRIIPDPRTRLLARFAVAKPPAP